LSDPKLNKSSVWNRLWLGPEPLSPSRSFKQELLNSSNPQKICGWAKTLRARDRTVERFMLDDDEESLKMSRKGLMKESESSSPVLISASPLAEDIFVLVVAMD